MKKYFVVLLHIGFWACYLLSILIILVVAYRNSPTISDRELRIVNALKNLFFFAFLPSFISFNLFYFYLYIFLYYFYLYIFLYYFFNCIYLLNIPNSELFSNLFSSLSLNQIGKIFCDKIDSPNCANNISR